MKFICVSQVEKHIEHLAPITFFWNDFNYIYSTYFNIIKTLKLAFLLFIFCFLVKEKGHWVKNYANM